MSPLCRTSLLELRTFSCVEWTWSSWKTANPPFPINTNALCCLDFVGFFSLWGNKGCICGDLSLGYPLLAMPAPAASNLRPIQKHFSELEIQSMTFPNNALVTVGKIKWVQKNKAEDQWMKGFITATIWRLNKSTQNPPKDVGSQCTTLPLPSKSPFHHICGGISAPFPFPELTHWREAGASLNTCWTKGEDRLTIRGW